VDDRRIHMVAPEREESVAGSDDRVRGPKKSYSPPRLTVHGRIEEITAAGGVTPADGLVGSQLI